MSDLTERRAEFVYNAARLAAIAANAPIVPVPWIMREEAFHKQFLDVIARQCEAQRSSSPEELHGSWIQAYLAMGWRYGEQYSREKKTHPDLVPYAQLSQLERDKDAVFVALCEIARKWIYDVGAAEPQPAAPAQPEVYDVGGSDAFHDWPPAQPEQAGAREMEQALEFCQQGNWGNHYIARVGLAALLANYAAQQNADLARQLAEAERERDLAIAHDRQAYPTASAYEKVCKARTRWQERAEALGRDRDKLRGLLRRTTKQGLYHACEIHDGGLHGKCGVCGPCLRCEVEAALAGAPKGPEPSSGE